LSVMYYLYSPKIIFFERKLDIVRTIVGKLNKKIYKFKLL
jgi:hypothetical protein